MAYFAPAGSGGIPVEVTTSGSTGIVLSLFNETLAVASGATENILTQTVPIGKKDFLLSLEVSGTNIATYDIMVNNTQYARIRTYFGGPFNGLISFGDGSPNSPQLMAGDIIEINVTNFRPESGDFECRLQYLEV